VLLVQHLFKDYPGSVRALDDVSMTVRDGEFVVLIGLSGSARARCCAASIAWSSQRLAESCLTISTSPRRTAAICARSAAAWHDFQQFTWSNARPCLTNVLTGRLGYVSQWQSLTAHWGEDDYRRALISLDRVGLRDRAHQRADRLSGGQQQAGGDRPRADAGAENHVG